jgi:hypothetical protein
MPSATARCDWDPVLFDCHDIILSEIRISGLHLVTRT